MKLAASGIVAIAGVGVLAALGLWVWKKGGIVPAAGAVVTGGVDTISEVVGLPTTEQTSTDAEVARWIIDNVGQFQASKWSGAPAYLRAQLMPAGSGKPPPADSAVGRELLPIVETNAETARLLARYPVYTAPEAIYGGYQELPGYGGPAPESPL